MYEQKLLLGSEHVDLHRRMRTSVLFSLLQTVSIRHTEQLGMGRDKTLDKGLLWVVTRMHAEIARMPEYDETVVIRSWPGETMHLLFPRYYEIVLESGEVLVRASAVWSLMDEKERTAVFPDEYGIVIEGEENGRELPWLVPVKPLETTQSDVFRVPYSYVDINGHLNNTRYFDLAEDRIPAAAEGCALKAVTAEYNREVRLGEDLNISLGVNDNDYYVAGETDHPCFRLQLTFAEKE
jgi:acyl-ACP thioesterase